MLKYNLNNLYSLSNAAFGGNGKGTGKITIPKLDINSTSNISPKWSNDPIIGQSQLERAIKPLITVRDAKRSESTENSMKTGTPDTGFSATGAGKFTAKHSKALNAIGEVTTNAAQQIKGFNETQKTINSAFTSALDLAGPIAPLLKASIGAFDMIGGALGAKTDIIDKNAAKRAGFSSGNNTNEILSSVPVVGTVFSAFGGRTDTSRRSSDIDSMTSAYGGSVMDIDAAQKMSGKKMVFGKRKANKFINEQNRVNDIITSISQDSKLRKSNSAADTYLSQNQNRYAGYEPKLLLSKKGMKFPELDRAREIISSWSIKLTENQDTQKFQLGGKMNLIPEGALHARKHNLEEVNPELEGQITKKGIPVITHSEGGVTQTAEIEKNEWTLRKEFTDQLESLYSQYQKDPSDNIAIEAGKLVCFELLKNTDDRSGLIKSIK